VLIVLYFHLSDAASMVTVYGLVSAAAVVTYCKTLIFRMHLFFVNFESSIKLLH